ncbi:hypothetical protein [Neisseria weaveri]|uniref:Periplasmic protein n=1 Tax=Neisseria weaveri TaxID=28091 RepID=A0A448VNZ0_9NEIS|nr:hypothetical protein [Neisseria weaveri]EGV34913.1 hypothetical protein l13_17720 [Neisseria weaveri ATCC 51223]EGV37514.1 hypothetical protein l11_12670 [Neisseria weaveri LMG 5135]SAY52084.1 Periplasmic protein [Neisseria weaveri]VEJ51510.1 Periplasmic protein [Neisseria weaveri]
MKWLFFILVALNIIVFGGMVAGRVVEKQKAVVAPTVPMVGKVHELSLPDNIKDPGSEKLDWVTDDGKRADQLEEEKKAKEAAKLAQEKKAREEKKRKEENSQQSAQELPVIAQRPQPAAGNVCVATASVSLEEDVYHRIKGLLNRWPHAATRTVEKRDGAVKKAKKAVVKHYRVVLPSNGDAIAQMDSLAAKGFTGSLYQGQISAGIVKSRSAAQVLVSRLAASGFGGASVVEQEERSRISEENELSVAKMKVVFLAVNDKEIKEIQSIVGKYGQLARNKCK